MTILFILRNGQGRETIIFADTTDLTHGQHKPWIALFIYVYVWPHSPFKECGKFLNTVVLFRAVVISKAL
jgi:hypothetical protein